MGEDVKESNTEATDIVKYGDEPHGVLWASTIMTRC